MKYPKHVETTVANSKYGTINNFLLCHDLGIKAHIPSLEKTHRGSGRQKGIFPKEAFTYNPENDTFTCPAGKSLKRRRYNKKRNYYEYKAHSEICAHCVKWHGLKILKIKLLEVNLLKMNYPAALLRGSSFLSTIDTLQ